MSMQHHNEGMSPEMRKLFDEEKDARKRFADQVAGRARRTWSDGRLGPTDDGDLAFAVGPHPDHDLIVIDFGKPVEFVSVQPQQAVELAQTLIKHARALSREPLRVVIQ